MRFLVDNQLPPALARLLERHGHRAEHISEIGSGSTTDRDISLYALSRGAVVVTKDEDFADAVLLGRESPVIVWVRFGNSRKTTLLAWFEPRVDQIVEAVDSGNRLIELR